MGTVSKALTLLDILKRPDARLGLTEISRQAGFDKATTRRMLLELMANGFVEQDDIDRNYVLGPVLQVLGKAREERFPFYKTIQPIVRNLSELTGETVHATEYSAGNLLSIYAHESDKSNRVSLSLGLKLPLHATASGIAFLAASTTSFVETFMKKPRSKLAANTPIEAAQIQQLITQAKQRGFSISNQSFEDGVHSVAKAIVDQNERPIGTIAIAMPTSRVTPERIDEFGKMVVQVSHDVSLKLFGRPLAPRPVS